MTIFMSEGIKDSYCLLIKLIRPIVLTPGKLGTFNLPVGWYVYTGSGGSSLEGRLSRHGRSHPKRLQWHIDYLLAHPAAELREALAFPGYKGGECSLNYRIKEMRGARVLLPGFGSSDCTAGCGSHLVYFEARPHILRAIPEGRRWGLFSPQRG